MREFPPDIIAGRGHDAILALAEQNQTRPGRHIYRLSPFNIIQFAHGLCIDARNPIDIVNDLSSREVRSGLLFGKRDIAKLAAALRRPAV